MASKPMRSEFASQRDRTTSDLPTTGFIRQAQLIPTVVPFSSATLWRRVKDGSFPTPVKLSAGCTAWRIEDIRAWMDSKVEA